MPTINLKYGHSAYDAPSALDFHVPAPYNMRQAIDTVRTFVRSGYRDGTWAACDLPGGRSYTCRNVSGEAVGRLSQ
jgi:hypothetical protein